jgi:amidohydrolase
VSIGDLPVKVAPLFDPASVRSLVQLRSEIHRDPELSLGEERTARRLEERLRLTPGGRVSIERVAGTGVIARVAGRRTGKGIEPVAIRGDIDALPIQEDTGLPYASATPGVMHACGHDVHATWAVGAAELLAKDPADGDVLVVLQPAEEIGAGALAILETGVLDGVAAIVGGHVDRRFPVGQVVVDDGPLAASSDSFTIELRGAGAHAARPHESNDVVVALAALITAAQTIVSRRLNPAIPGVVTIAAVHAGDAANVIPDYGRVRGTIRAVDPVSRALMLGELRRIAEGVASAHGVQASLSVDEGTPPLINAAWPTSAVRDAAIVILGRENVVPLGTVNMAAEDFAYYAERIPACFIRVGAREPGGHPIPAHSPRFYAAPESIFVGAAVLAEAARRISAGTASGVGVLP